MQTNINGDKSLHTTPKYLDSIVDSISIAACLDRTTQITMLLNTALLLNDSYNG